MNDQHQCCDRCSTPKYIFVNKDNSISIVCNDCYSREELRIICKQIWDIQKEKFVDIPLEVSI